MTHFTSTARLPRPGTTLILWLLAIITLLPFGWMAWTSQKPRARVEESYEYLADVKGMPESEIQRHFDIPSRPLMLSLRNSVIVSVSCSVIGVALASLAGYAFAKKFFPLKNFLFDLVIVSMSIPAALLMMPFFHLTTLMHIYDTLPALILPFMITGFGVVYMRQTISTVPNSTLDAARLDGLTDMGMLFRVVIPQIWPSIITLGVLQFLTSWGAFVLPNSVVSLSDNYTLGILLGRIPTDYHGLMWNDIMLIVMTAIIPVAVVFAAFSRWILRGFALIGNEVEN